MKLEEIKNHGLIIPEIVEGDHYVLGGYSKIKGEVINPKGSYRAWLPIKEFQNIRGIETQSCTCFATNNALETLINFKFGIQANYSDRALAIASDINPYIGGDPHNVAECIRKNFGAVDEAILPFSDDIKSPDDYIKPKPLPKEIISKGAEWIDNWEFSHEWVFTRGTSIEDKHKALKEALTKGTVCVSVTAWIYDNDNNVYTKPVGGLDTHWCQLFEYDEEGYPIVFDSYDGFIKKLSKTYDFNIAKVYYLNKRENKINPILQAIINIIKKILDIDQEIINKNVLVKPVVPIMPVAEPPIISFAPSEEPPVIQPAKTKMPTIKDFALAIQHHEGYFKPGENGYPDGSLSYRNANPGNLRPTKYVIDYLGALGEGVGGFARFISYEKGFEGLCMFIENCQNNMVRGYHDATIKSFFETYAPSEDNNNPLAYAKAVAKRLGVGIDFKIKDLS